MSRYRIGVSLASNEWYWEQIRKGLQRRAHERPVELISLDDIIVDLPTYHGEELVEWFTQHPRHNLDAFICLGLSISAWYRVLDCGVPIVSLTESDIAHPLLLAPHGLDDIARSVGAYIAERLQGNGTVLIVGGLLDSGEAGRSRLLGLRQAFLPYPHIRWTHVPSLWGYSQAYTQVYPTLLCSAEPLDAIIGLTDLLALAAFDAAQALGLLREQTLTLGFGAEPAALAALADGTMSATVDLFPLAFASTALDLAIQTAQHRPIQTGFPYQWRLLTHSQKQRDQQKVHLSSSSPRQLDYREIDQVLSRLGGVTLDRWQLVYGVIHLIQANYHYDHVQIFRWDSSRQVLSLEQMEQTPEVIVPATELPTLTEIAKRKISMYIADTRHSVHIAPDPHSPDLRTRIIVPILLGDTLLGLLDIHCYSVRPHRREDLARLEYLAGRLGLILRSADLYQEAVQADRLKTRLLANVSHEFRTPLNTILHYTQNIISDEKRAYGSTDPLLLREIHHINHNAYHLARLIDDLLDLSRAEIGALTLAPEPIATHTFLSKVFHQFSDSQGDQSAVTWNLLLPDSLPTIWADPLRLRQILFNLLDNARKFTSAGQITLGAEVVPPHLHLSLSDTGSGIPQALQERIFEPFVTGETSRRPEGVGLGLSITRHLVSLHQGSLILESQPGSGSIFHLYLPLAHPSRSAPSIPALTQQDHYPPLKTQILTAQSQTRETILIVDDDAQVRDLYRSLVEQSLPEYHISTVSGGAEALSILEHLIPSLIILDLVMPYIDGFMVLDRIRMQPQTRHVPVLIVSEYNLTSEDVKRINYPHVVFVNKDILSPQEFTALLHQKVINTHLESPASPVMKQFVAYLHQHYADHLTLQNIAEALHISERHLNRLLHQELGMPPWEYINRYRIKKARELLQQTSLSVSTIAHQVGFSDASYFGRVFRQYTNTSPRAYRNHQVVAKEMLSG